MHHKDYVDGVSIVVPVYNAEAYLRKCIDSILNQSFRKLELILIDDGATDKSGSICDEYSEKDPRVKVVHKQNAGVSAARNAGIDIASYKYLMFVDSDDYIDSEMLEKMHEQAEKSGADCVMSGLRYTFEETGQEKEFALENVHFSVYGEINQHYGMIADAYGFNCVYAKLYLTKTLQMNEVRFLEKISILEDGSFVSMYLQHCSTCLCMGSVFYNYRQLESMSLMKRFNENAIDALAYKCSVDQSLLRELNRENTAMYYKGQFSLLWSFCVQIYTRSSKTSNEKRALLEHYVNHDVTKQILSQIKMREYRGKRLLTVLLMRLGCVSVLHYLMEQHFS